MCELFALSARTPTTITLSLETFSQRGGGTGPHADGWGLAYYQDGDAQIIRDTRPAAKSPWVSFVAGAGLVSTIMLSHIRKATTGTIRLPNTQPFRRELAGAVHVFAHNGDLSGLDAVALGRFHPVGETDSERAFCILMKRLDDIWTPNGVPPLDARRAVFEDFCADMRGLGTANFLYSDGHHLFAHGHKRTQTDGIQRPPGLHVLCRTCAVDPDTTRSAGLTIDGGQQVLLFASVPLSDEDWRPLNEGEVVVAELGAIR